MNAGGFALVFQARYTKIMSLDVAFALHLTVYLCNKSSNSKTQDFVNDAIIFGFPLTIFFCK